LQVPSLCSSGDTRKIGGNDMTQRIGFFQSLRGPKIKGLWKFSWKNSKGSIKLGDIPGVLTQDSLLASIKIDLSKLSHCGVRAFIRRVARFGVIENQVIKEQIEAGVEAEVDEQLSKLQESGRDFVVPDFSKTLNSFISVFEFAITYKLQNLEHDIKAKTKRLVEFAKEFSAQRTDLIAQSLLEKLQNENLI
jgi:hypothetical protein